MKYLIGTVVFLMLFVLPIGSWYYLQSGLDYRKAALKELEPKGAFESVAIDVNTLASKTTLMHLKPLGDDIIAEVFDQYGGAESFQLMSIEKPNEDHKNWIEIDAFTANSISSGYNDAGFILIDTSGALRNTYPADMEGLKRMIEHTSIVLPRVKEMDVKMRK